MYYNAVHCTQFRQRARAGMAAKLGQPSCSLSNVLYRRSLGAQSLHLPLTAASRVRVMYGYVWSLTSLFKHLKSKSDVLVGRVYEIDHSHIRVQEKNIFYFSRVKKVSIWKPEGLVVTVFKTFSAHIENQSYTLPSLQKPARFKH